MQNAFKKFVERGKIDIPNTHIFMIAHFHWLCTDTSIKTVKQNVIIRNNGQTYINTPLYILTSYLNDIRIVDGSKMNTEGQRRK